jgi:adenosine deaminase/adenosine deaminase CECR1
MKMRKKDPSRIFRNIGVALTLLLVFSLTPQAQTRSRNAAKNPELATARYFESIRKSPPQMLAFLRRMPKGADLHSHLSGAIYAESYVQWASDKGLCVNQATTVLSQPPCDQAAGQLPVNTALSNPSLYRKLIDSWSMRYWQYTGNNGHDQFFDSFGKFGAAGSGQTGKMLAEVASRAARGRVLYLELMLTPDGPASSLIGQQVGWNGDFNGTLNKLNSSGIAGAAATGVKAIQDAEDEKNRLLKCGTPQADAGCSVTIRYIAQVSRGAQLGPVFAQMVTGMALSNDPNSKVVALNLVQPEDSLLSMQNFRVQMEMLNFLRPLYPKAHITLHAGELAPGLVPPEGLTFHVRESVMKARAERIGHGVSVMNEENPYELLKEMARRKVMVEICLTSNDVILGIRKEQHPLTTYLQYGVPVALATDDEGVSRSEISREYLKAAEEHELGYRQLKTMARNSLEYAFLPGASLWADAGKFTPRFQCAKDISVRTSISDGCKEFLATSEKARLQWKLEEEFKSFERQY